ncbi:MAG: hypothetical protein JXA19_06735 [Anaerolineales bacterium]|nr:hypothetical protein [Anaerolineales bacterium]
MSAISVVTKITSLAALERSRLFPTRGEVLVRTGQTVKPTDVVARALLETRHLVLDAAKVLNVPPAEVEQFMERKVGDKLNQGGIIAKREGTFASRELRAPRDGRVAAINIGKVLLEVAAKPFELQAGYPGVISSVIPERGVIIHIHGAWIQGLWGNGMVDSSTLYCLAKNKDYIMNKKDINPERRGTVMYAGHCNDPRLLEYGMELGLKGLILGSMLSPLVPLAVTMPYPIILIEGFGNIPTNQSAHKILRTNDNKPTAINAQAYDRQKGNRPEIVIPLPETKTANASQEVETFHQGAKVRVLRSPYQGEVGEIESLPGEKQVFANGLTEQSARIFLERGETVLVPLANIEVLG